MSRNLLPPMLRRRRSPAAYHLPAGTRVYAIGDVHGRVDRLIAVEAAIRAHAEEAPPTGAALVVFIGDYIDRGPDSKAVIEKLLQRSFADLPARFLLGNHEDAMLRFLDDPAVGQAWLAYGGMATLASYEVRPEGAEDLDRMERLRLGLAAALPEAHRAFLDQLELSIQLGDYLFVHAGVRPSRALDKQLRDDLLTIREPFLSSRKRLPWRVVHGHTIVEQVGISASRIAIDTGAYATGQLTCVVIEGARADVLAVPSD